MQWHTISTSPLLAASASLSGSKSTLLAVGAGTEQRGRPQMLAFSPSFAALGLPPRGPHRSDLTFGENMGALGGLPLIGGVPPTEAHTDRALLCGEAAGVHLNDLALVWLGVAVEALDDRELTWFDHLSPSAFLEGECARGTTGVRNRSSLRVCETGEGVATGVATRAPRTGVAGRAPRTGVALRD